jgi:MoaA/NifB/PqqE/SkfB family radical SAM enzyme
MGPTGDSVNVIQIHPTRRCNLRCRHCYSASGPEQSAQLALAPLQRLLADAAAEGFNALGLSGGEPLLYKPLQPLLRTARSLGYLTTVTTNGTLLQTRRLEALAPHLSLLAISVDGVPESHDQMRGLDGAFKTLRRGLERVRASGIPFGLIFSLTLSNLHELEWVAEFAVEQGARLLQIHPLEQVGRARDFALMPPDDLELAFAFIEVARLQAQFGQRIVLQFDVADRTVIERDPGRAFAIEPPEAAPVETPLAALVSPLVVQEDGWVVPIQHGFSTSHAVAHLDRGPFLDQARRWKAQRHRGFLELSRRVWSQLRQAPEHLPFTNWYSAITQGSTNEPIPLQMPVRMPAPATHQDKASLAMGT